MKKRKKDSDLKKNVVFNIQSIIMSVLMAITLVTIVTMGFLLYQRFKLAIDKMAVSNTEATVESTVDRVNSDLLDIRQIFNAANYNIVQEFDISSEKFAEQFSLLYEVNSDKIESLALYGNEGRLIASEPVAVEKENIDVTGQDWYKNAESAIENVHFSVPHIQICMKMVCIVTLGCFTEPLCGYKRWGDSGKRSPSCRYEIFGDRRCLKAD